METTSSYSPVTHRQWFQTTITLISYIMYTVSYQNISCICLDSMHLIDCLLSKLLWKITKRLPDLTPAAVLNKKSRNMFCTPLSVLLWDLRSASIWPVTLGMANSKKKTASLEKLILFFSAECPPYLGVWKTPHDIHVRNASFLEMCHMGKAQHAIS